MKSADELGYYAAQYERSVQRRAVDTDTGSLSNTNHHSQSSRSPSDASLLHDDQNRSSLVRVDRSSSELSRHLQGLAAYTTDLQRCVRETTSSVTRFINAFDDARTRRHGDVQVRRRAARLWRRAADDCTAVADGALPPLVEAIRAVVMRPTSVTAHMQLINAASDAVRPGVRMLLSVRQLLNETDDDDVDTISLLTSLVLAVAESLQRMRRAAQRALAAYAESRPRDPASVSRGRRVMAPEDVDERAVVPHSGSTGSSTALSDSNDYRLTLVALESCDAAYRQIQGCGACLDQLTSTSSVCWHKTDYDYVNDELQVRLLSKLVQLCYALGTSVTKVSRSAKDGYIDDFCESMHQFAGAVSRIIIIIPQMAEGGDDGTTRKLCLSGRAIRHCASSLVSSARQIASDRQHWTSYRSYADHSRALSRALTHLIRFLSVQYDSRLRITDAR